MSGVQIIYAKEENTQRISYGKQSHKEGTPSVGQSSKEVQTPEDKELKYKATRALENAFTKTFKIKSMVTD
jgi:hypothetical protein